MSKFIKKYKLIVLSGGGYTLEFEVVADYFTTQTSGGTSSGFYSFSLNGEFICAYPIDKTIINEVQRIKNDN
jgi:hypothetical protein